MKHRDEPIVNLEVGPNHEEFESVVDTGADKSSLSKIPTGTAVGKRVCDVIGAEGKPFRAHIIEDVEIKGNSKRCVADFIYLPRVDGHLLGRGLQVQ